MAMENLGRQAAADVELKGGTKWGRWGVKPIIPLVPPPDTAVKPP